MSPKVPYKVCVNLDSCDDEEMKKCKEVNEISRLYVGINLN